MHTISRTAVCAIVSLRAATRRMSAVAGSKRSMVQIGTHSGSFHCDEALGCFLLKRLDQYKDADIVRSRDPGILNGLDVVIDVGGTYDPERKRFDHHQRGFSEAFGHGFTTKLSSAGLVYKHFGKDIIAGLINLPPDHPDVQIIYLAVYKHFLEAIDAIDNGINQFPSDAPPRYVSSTNLSARVGKLNPRWNEPWTDDALMERFLQAVKLAGQEFLESVDYFHQCWLPARSIVKSALKQRFEVDASGEIIKLPQGGVPWKEHLYDLEAELAIPSPIKFCLYEDTREHKWRVQAVSVAAGSFENRKSLPAAWRGLRDDELSQLSGIPGCVFVHSSGFIGGNCSEEGVTEMARKGLVLE